MDVKIEIYYMVTYDSKQYPRYQQNFSRDFALVMRII